MKIHLMILSGDQQDIFEESVMREVPKFSEGGEIVVALEDRDLIALEDTFAKAKDLWVQEWIKQGSTDEGSACLGKGLEVWHLSLIHISEPTRPY